MSNNLGNKEIMAKNIQYYMDRYEKSRNDMCEALGVKYTTFTDWVKGNTYPRIDKIELMANYFGISKADLVEERIIRTVDTGQRIKSRRLQLGYSVEELAKKLGKNRATIYRYENNEIENLPTTVLEPLAQALETTPAHLMGWDDSPDSTLPEITNIHPVRLKKFPLLGSIACGEATYSPEPWETYIEASEDIKADFCLTAKGDSMINARIHDGDIVFIREQPLVDNGEIAAVVINSDSEATLKRVYYYQDKNLLILKAENSKYGDMIYQDDELEMVRILGKAVSFQSLVK